MQILSNLSANNLSGTNSGDQDLSGKQDLLVSGTNLKTINSTSLLGSGDIAITGAPPTGGVMQYAGRTAPSGWLLCDGSAVSRTTYSALFAALVNSVGTCTASSSTDLITKTSHGLRTGDAVYISSSAPGGISLNTIYYADVASSSTFYLCTSRDNAFAGTFINLTSSTSPVIQYAPYGIPAGSTTTFNVPDLRSRIPVGLDSNGEDASNNFNNLGQTGGAEAVTLTPEQMPVHSHGYVTHAMSDIPFQLLAGGGVVVGGNASTDTAGGGQAHNNLQPYLTLNFIIKT